MKLFKAFAIGAVLAAGAAFAQEEPTEPNAVAREALMKVQGMNAGILGNMASGKDPYDPAKAEAAKAALIDSAIKVETVFAEPGAPDPASKVKPEIWTNWEDFLVKANALTVAATALDTSSPETIGAGMAAVGASCSGCHQAYRN